MKKIKLVRLIHRICSIIMACVVFNQFNFFDGELAEQTSFLLLLGLWLVFGITISMPIAGVGFFIHTFAFYKDRRYTPRATIKEEKLYGEYPYSAEIENEIWSGIKFTIALGYIVAAILIISQLKYCF